MKPEWEEAAQKLAGEGAILGWVDATVETQLAGMYGVQGYPTIKVFPGTNTNKTYRDAKDYNGERTAQGIVKYMMNEIDLTGVPKEIPQLLNYKTLEETCNGHNEICVIGVLPHILDSGASGRNKYRDLLTTVSKTFRGSSFHFIWMEGTTQPELESVLELTFGYPAVVALSLDRQAYAVMHGSYNEKSVTAFLHGVTNGRQATIKLSKAIDNGFNIVETQPWDGLDGKPIEEEMSLTDIMGWDDDEDEEEEMKNEL